MADKKDYANVKKNIKSPTKETDPVHVDDRPKMEQVATGTKRKRGLTERFVTAFIGPDGFEGVGRYLTHDVVVPAIKDIVVNSVTSGINMMVYGSEGAPRRSQWRNTGSSSVYTPRTNYSQSYSRPKPQTRVQGNQRDMYDVQDKRYGFNSEEYIMENRQEAVSVLERLVEQCDEYGWVSIADFYDLIGIDTTYTDNNYGWTDLRMAKVIVSRGGYSLRLPRVEQG